MTEQVLKNFLILFTVRKLKIRSRSILNSIPGKQPGALYFDGNFHYSTQISTKGKVEKMLLIFLQEKLKVHYGSFRKNTRPIKKKTNQ